MSFAHLVCSVLFAVAKISMRSAHHAPHFAQISNFAYDSTSGREKRLRVLTESVWLFLSSRFMLGKCTVDGA